MVSRNLRIMILAAGICMLPSALMASDPTFNKDVLPILQQNCQSCHRPGQIAPMSLLTYDSCASVGKGDQERSQHPEDAALVREPGIWPFYERQIAEAGRHRHDCEVGR